MRRVERLDDLNETLLAVLRSNQAGIWTALPGVITKFNSSAMTAEVQTTVKVRRALPAVEATWDTIPLLVDCPVVFPGGGGYTLTFPVSVGDECLVIFSSRCIDSWWQSGGVQQPPETRFHDLSDGFVLVGPRSQPRVLPAIATNAVELRSDTGASYVRIDAVGNITLNAPTVKIQGNMTVTGSVVALGDVVGAGKSLSTHKHGGVVAGGAQTGVPV